MSRLAGGRGRGCLLVAGGSLPELEALELLARVAAAVGALRRRLDGLRLLRLLEDAAPP